MDNDKKVVLPTNDLSFKKVFSSPESKEILIGLINDFYNLNIVDVRIDNPYNIEEYNKEFEKNGYFKTEVDLFCIAADNSKFTIEIQCKLMEYFIERTLYYTFQKYCSSYGDRELMKIEDLKYSLLFPTYSINILNYNHFKDTRAVHKFGLYDEVDGSKLTDPNLISIGYFELCKDDKTLNKNLKYWRQFFVSGEVDNNAPNYIKKAGKIINLSNFSKEERKMISTIEKIEQDSLAQKIYIKNEGILEGIKKIAINLLHTEMPIEQISKVTGLTEQEISKLEEEQLEN